MRIIIILLLMIIAGNANAWHDEKTTHKVLSEYVVESYFSPELYETSVNGQKFKYWILEGSDLEDQGSKVEFATGTARSLNHFHNPTKSLADAGLTDVPFSYLNGKSTIKWAQDADYQATKVGGDWAWNTVRTLYYKYLTTSDKTNRESWQSDYLKGLGYQMHLIEDMSQPNHVRNDTHLADGSGKNPKYGFETWAVTNESKIRSILATGPIPTVTVNLYPTLGEDTLLTPVARLFDTRDNLSGGVIIPSAAMDRGLAEFTNTNFFSEDTTFADGLSTSNKQYFPYPRKAETNLQNFIDNNLDVATSTDVDGSSFSNFKINKQNTTGVSLECLAKPGPNTKKYYNEFGEGSEFYTSFHVDEECFQEYAKHLFPRAVAYSKALLDYFFRGTLSIDVVAPEDITFRSIKVTASNSTPNETMGTGEVSLVIRYKALAETPQGGGKYLLNNPSADYSYKVVKLSNVNLSSPRELTFDFSADPLPMNYSEITMQLVYKGKLGNENNSVAVSVPKAIDGIYCDIILSLPPSGVYAKSSDSSTNATFDELKVTALSKTSGGLSGGTITLALEYRTAVDDQFQSVLVNTEPANAAGYIFRTPEKNSVSTLPEDTPVELVFDLSLLPLSIRATKVEINVIYTHANGVSQSIGYIDISEPTPIDVYNTTDYTCINNTWYHYDDPAAVAIANISDTKPHIISNVSFLVRPYDATALDARTSNTLFAAGPLPTGRPLRLGYILTDVIFYYAYSETRTDGIGDIFVHNPTSETYPGLGYKNDGGMQYMMFPFRGAKLWQGAGVIFINSAYPLGSACTFESLNQILMQ